MEKNQYDFVNHPPDIKGIWYSMVGSKLEIISNNDNIISGIYNHKINDNDFITTTITGVVGNFNGGQKVPLCFTGFWKDSKTVTSYTGTVNCLGSKIIVTLLESTNGSNILNSTYIGYDIFTKDPSIVNVIKN
jgi:hypothetical protein